MKEAIKKESMILTLFIVLSLPDVLYADSSGVLLWNKLGSTAEVENSEIGSNLLIVSGAPDYLPCQFDNGVNIDNFLERVYIPVESFPETLGNKSFTIQFWFKPNYDIVNSRLSSGRYTLFAGAGAGGLAPYTGQGSISAIVAASSYHVTSIAFQLCSFDIYNYCFPQDPQLTKHANWTAGDLVHIALVYDIEKTDGKATRVYIDGQEHVYSEIDIPTAFATPIPGNNTLLGNDWAISGRTANGVIDNFIVYDYAKFDFSDRFNENPRGGGVALSVPTLTPWALLGLAGALAGLASLRLRRR